MFRLFSRERAAVLEQSVQIPATPTPMKVSEMEIGGVALAEYEQAAKSIGFSNVALLKAQLLNFFAENGICVYPHDKVSAYLNALAEKEAKSAGEERVWRWKPLRNADVGKLVSTGDDRNGQIDGKQYRREVPLPVLLTVRKITERFPETEVYFYVSDIEARNPDPFLAIMAAGMDRLIIERWDEPAFRM